MDWFYVVLVLNMIFAITLIFLERRDPTATWAWILILTLLPGVGFILYLFFGLRFRKRKRYRKKQEKDFYLQKHFEQQFPLMIKDIKNPLHKSMMYMGFISQPAAYVGGNDVELYTDGNAKFAALFDSIEKAQNHIHVNYYIIQADKVGLALLELLVKKALQGVKVKFLYDSMGCRKLPRHFFRPLIKAGGKVSKFSSIVVDINYRDHRKIVVIDGREAFVGGFNVGKEYVGEVKKFGYWRDTHLKIKGENVDSLQYRFLVDWSFATEEEVPFDSYYFPDKEHVGDAKIQIVCSGPDSKEEEIKMFFLKMIYGAQKSIYIQTPYFIPDQSMFEALKIAAASGVDVKVIIPDRPDHLFVHEANYSYVGSLLESGAKCYFYKGGFLHSKTIVVDGQIASVGTTNMDVRSFKLNFEVNAFIYNEQTTQKLESIFMEDLKKCEEITSEKYAQRSIWMKFKEAISRLISPIL